MVEKDPEKLGGTTAKSGGIFWILNNALMREDGTREDRGEAINYLAKYGFPEAYDSSKPYLGLRKVEYERLEVFYDEGQKMLDEYVLSCCPLATRYRILE